MGTYTEFLRHPTHPASLFDANHRRPKPILRAGFGNKENPIKWNLVNHDLRSIFTVAASYVSILGSQLNGDGNLSDKHTVLTHRLDAAQKLHFTATGSIKPPNTNQVDTTSFQDVQSVKNFARMHGFSTEGVSETALRIGIERQIAEDKIEDLGDADLNDFVTNFEPKSQSEVRKFFTRLYGLIIDDVNEFVTVLKVKLDETQAVSNPFLKPALGLLTSLPGRLQEAQTLLDINAIDWTSRKRMTFRQMVEKAKADMETNFRKKGVTISYLKSHVDEEYHFSAHPTLPHVVHNLLYNAVKQAPTESRIIITDLLTDDYDAFIIANNGNGISPDSSQTIFDLGVSGTKSTGLGLWFSRLVVERHGGIIQVMSEEGVKSGAVFYFILPKNGRTLSFRIAPQEVALLAYQVWKQATASQTEELTSLQI